MTGLHNRRGLSPLASVIAFAVIVASGCGAGGSTTVAVAPAQAQGEDDRPNVVVIQTDDQGLESMRVMKATNRLIGRRGATFRNNFTNWPICCPSRTTQLTGQYAHNHGVLGNAPPRGSYTAFPRRTNLAVWLDEAGYRVGHVGKFLNGYGPKGDRPQTPYDDRTEVPPGWTDWKTFAGGSLFGYYEYSLNEWESGDQGRTGTLVDYGRGAEDFKTDVSTAGAVELVSKYARAEAPFYLQVDYTAPHAGGPRGDKMPRPPFDCADFAKSARRHSDALDDMPFLPGRSPAFDEANVEDKPPRVAGLPRLSRKVEKNIKDEYRCRLESLLSVDEGVAAIIRRLRRTGELADTYVIYTSDNGYFQGEHRIVRGKGLVYEPAVRVPLLMRGPDIPAGVNVRDLTSNADFATTVLALTGASSQNREPDGKSLIPAARNPDRETGRELLIETLSYDAIRTQRYKWVEYSNGGTELYDLKVDEAELSNVADDPAYAEERSQLTAGLADLRDCSGATCSTSPELDVRYEGRSSDGSCIPGGLEVEVEGGDAEDLSEVSFALGRDNLAKDASPPFTHTLSRADLKAASPTALTTRAELVDGRRVVWSETLKACP